MAQSLKIKLPGTKGAPGREKRTLYSVLANLRAPRTAACQEAIDHFFEYVVLTLILTVDGTLENENELPVEEVCFSVPEAVFLHSAS